MTGFIESPIFPLAVSFGATMGPAFDTDIVVVESGKEYRNQNWSQPLQHGTVSLTAARVARMAIMRQWIYIARGRARPFRVRDVNDFEVPDANGIGVCILMTAATSSSDAIYQAHKRYTRGAETFDRLIAKPEVGTFALYDVTSSGRTLKLLNTHYTIDESTGLVTVLFTPDGELEWTGKFHVPMRFDIDQKEFETINREGAAYLQGLDEIPLVEIRI